ncbi:hypothetical protein ACT41I_14455 [Acinetobacter baumannii]|nr:hypothetical protein [Acinetobacter baumannii]
MERNITNSVRFICMLDICAVSVLKESIENLDDKKRKLLIELQNYDKPGNLISYYCAFLEKVSDQRGKLNKEELRDQILKDISITNAFFKEAKLIEKYPAFILEHFDEMYENHIELETESYTDFLKIINNDFKLFNTVSKKNRLATAKEIIQKAISLKINPRHITVSIALACLYQNSYAIRMCKFKKEANLYDHTNVYADIMAIQRVGKVRFDLENIFDDCNVIFITGDDSLKNLSVFYNLADVHVKDNEDEQSIKYSFNISWKDLLTEASESEIEFLTNSLVDYEDPSIATFDAY